MNNKGFTLVELLATLVILGIVVGITIVASNFNIGGAKEKTEVVFVKTLTNAFDMYLDSDGKKLKFNASPSGTTNKKNGNSYIYEGKINTGSGTRNVTISDIINSDYSPLVESDLVNPNNETVSCNLNAIVTIYRDSDYVYYYQMQRDGFSCLTDATDIYITNLPCDFLTSKGISISRCS